MDCYDESQWCCICNVPFKGGDRVEHDGKFFHKRCLKRQPRKVVIQIQLAQPASTWES